VAGDSPQTHRDVNEDNAHSHIKWATEVDAILTTEVLSTNTKILADSLCAHWGDHHSKQTSPVAVQHKALDELRRDLANASHHVSVSKVTEPSMKRARLNLWNPCRFSFETVQCQLQFAL